jgi:midasin
VGNDRPSLEPWRLNAVASSDAVAAIQANFDDFKRVKKLLASAQVEAEVRLTTGDIGMHGANAVPGWDFLRSIVDLDVTRFEKDFTNGVSPGGENVAGDVVSISKRIGKLSENIETVVQSTLIWVQGVDASSKPIMIKREIVAEGEDEEEEAEGSMTTYEAAVGGAMNPKRLEHIVHAVRNVVNDVKSIVDEAHAIDDRDVSNFVAARAGTVAPLLGLLRSAVRTVLFEYINFHKSSCKLESVLTALFLGLSVEGFCIPPEEADGEAGGGMMDDQSGTGMGAGEGEKDVADEIENEDQILGMEDLEKEEEEHKDKGGGEEEEDGGIEMQNDFEGVMEDVDAGGDDEDEDDPREDMEKEMGEDGDDGDVIDERMWNDEDDKDDEKNEAPEKYEKGSSVKQDEKQETETRAAEEDDDGPPKDPDQGEESGEDEKDRPKENDQSGAPDANDDGKQNEEEVEENHGKNPSLPEPEEFELDDLKLEEEDEQGEDAEDDANDESMQNEDAEELDGAPPEDVNADEQNENADGEMNEDGDGGLTDDVMDVDDDEVAQADDEEEGATDHLQDDAIAADDAMDEDGEEGGPQGQGDGGGGDQDVNETQGQGGEAGANAQGSDGQGEEETKQQAHGAMDTDVNEGNDGRQLPLPQSSTDIPSAGADGEGTGAGASGGEGTVAPMTGGPASDGDKKTPPPPQRQQDANPHRSLGDALKSWRERLNVVGDAAENDTAGDQGGDDGGGEGDEYEFERAAEKGGVDDEDGKGNKGIQTLGNATEEQATKNSLNDVPEESEDEDEEGLEPMEMRQDSRVDATDEGDQGPGNDDEREDDGASAAMKRQRKSSEPKKDIASTDAQTAAIDGEEADEDETMTERELVAGGEGETGEESTIALQLEHTSLGGAGEVVHELTPEDVELARIEAEQSLTQWREKSAKERGNEANAQNLWRKLEQLTTALSAELAEKLRLILEPTLASRLQGDYKTGKRLNMRKIIPYIASDFRKDKIWLRRSRPSARKYQVMLAIDDSRSMAENHCGHIALESMVLLARAMARLEVGEIGVVGFGAGANAVRTLHPLGAPFTDQEGPSLVSKLSFAEDNTLADRPMVQLLETMAARLSVAREQIRGGGTKLQQLVLIIADGRFHEKEALRRCMREVGAQRGLLVAFIVLDNPQNSLLNMQSVSFTGGKPVMKKYLDSFPFPFYVLVQDVSQLPATISDLLRQWFEMATSHD